MIKNTEHISMDIIPRKLNLTFNEISEKSEKNFILNNPLMTAFIATLSAIFPEGEKQFISSVRNYVPELKDEKLLADIKLFTKQEASHAKEHMTFNKRFNELGWDIATAEKFIKRKIKSNIKNWTHAEQLANTVSMEHLTATFSNFQMERKDLIDRLNPEVGRILIWHAIEETEHKAVSFDVYQECVGDKKLLRKAMRRNHLFFNLNAHIYTFLLVFKSKQVPSWAHIKEFFQILHGKNGLYKSIGPEIKDFYREDFHPWDHDNRELAKTWTEKLGLPNSH